MTNQAVAINYDNDAMTEILFADDPSLMNEDENNLQLHTMALNLACNKQNMKISTSKTEVMKISRDPGTLEIYVDVFKLKQVSEFKCLGSIYTADRRLDREIETRCQKANAVSYQLSPYA